MRALLPLLLLLSGAAFAQPDAAPRSPAPPPELGLGLEQVSVDALRGLLPLPAGLGGHLDVWTTVQRDGVAVRVTLRLEGDDLTLHGQPLGSVRADLTWTPGVPGVAARVEVRGPLVDRLRLVATLPLRLDPLRGPTWRADPDTPLRLDLELRRMNLARATDVWPVLALAGGLDLELTARGTLGAPTGRLRLAGQDLRWRGEDAGAVVGEIALAEAALKTELAWSAAAGGAVKVRGALPVRLDAAAADGGWDDARPATLDVEAKGLGPASLRPFWPAHPAAAFTVDARLTARGALDALVVDGALTGALKDPGRPDLPLRGALTVGPAAQSLRFTVGEDLFVARADARMDLVAARRADAPLAAAPLDAEAAAALPLPTLRPYLPAGLFDPRGRLTGTLTVGGTLGAPRAAGTLNVADGALTLVPLNQRLRDITLQSRFADATWHLEGLSARAGAGRVEGAGTAKLVATPPGHRGGLWDAWRVTADGGLRLTRFPIIQATLPHGLIDAQIALQAEAGPDDAALRVRVDEGAVRLLSSRMPTARAVPRNRGVRYLDWAGDVKPPPNVFAGEGRLQVTVELAKPVPVEGPKTAVELTGALTVRRDGDAATVEGGFRTDTGRFDLFDNPFEVRRGRVTMLGGDLETRRTTGDAAPAPAEGHAVWADPDKPTRPVPLEPILDFVARARVVDTVVLVGVRGPARRPELVLASHPPLPEYQILTLLITGRVDAVDERNGEVRRKVARLVSTFHNPSLSRQLYDRLGVDKLGLGFGSSVTQPILTVGKQIDRQLYVETVYRHNAPPDENEKEGRVEYRLSPRWTLDTTYGDAAEGSLGVTWQTHFGGPPLPPPPADFEERVE